LTLPHFCAILQASKLKGRMPMLYTRNKPHKRKPNWKNILLTCLCLVVVIVGAGLLISANSKSEKIPPAPTPGIDETPVPTATPEPTQPPTATPAPTDEATQQPTEAPTPEPTPRGSGVQSVTFGAVGDIVMHGQVLQAAKSGNSYDFTKFFDRIVPYISWQDFTIANLECSIAEKGFDEDKAPEALLSAMKEAGIDVVALSNEINATSGAEAFAYTTSAVENNGLLPVGTENVRILTKDAMRIAVLNYVEDPGTEESATHVLTEDNIAADISYVMDNDVDFVIAYIHWGDSGKAEVTETQKQWASYLAESGVDVILGSHAHVVQSMEMLEGASGHKTLVVYGLGNFESPYRNNGADAGVILNFTLTKDFDNGTLSISDVTYAPTFTLKYSSVGKYSIEIMSAVEYSDKKYQNMSLDDRARVAAIPAEIQATLGTEIGTMETEIRKLPTE